VVAIAHDQPVAVLLTLLGEPGKIGVHLRLHRLGQHPPRALPHQLIDQRRTTTRTIITSRRLGHYAEHGSYLPDRRANVGLA
jgi:hypothetical protein